MPTEPTEPTEPTTPDASSPGDAVAIPRSSTNSRSSTELSIRRVIGDRIEDATDRLATEEPLEIRVGGAPLSVTMRTPGHDLELAAGFCLTEGIVTHPDELEAVTPCGEAEHGNVVDVVLTEEAMARRAEAIACATRETFMSSSCGLCGKQSIDRIRQHIPPIKGDFTVTPSVIRRLPDIMRQAQATFEQTGGLHAAAIFTPDGTMRVLREDVGRHNAVDKVIGHELLLGRVPISEDAPVILQVSGRSSFEIMQKAAVAGIAMVCAVSAPSSLAVQFAQEVGMTLVGFVRGERMNVYADRAKRLAVTK